jgi:hypothetical protein
LVGLVLKSISHLEILYFSHLEIGDWVTWKSTCSVALPSVNRFFVHLEINWLGVFTIWKMIGGSPGNRLV